MLGWFGFLFDLLLLHHCTSLVGLLLLLHPCASLLLGLQCLHRISTEKSGMRGVVGLIERALWLECRTHTHMFILLISRLMLAFLSFYVIMHIDWLLRVLGVVWISC